jgi:UDP-2,3-diacylglucosamine pyrophosphatase LpxH
MDEPVTVVISDLHISAGPLDDCDAELEGALVGFLGGLAARAEPVELVINGDFIDFVQAPPYEGADLESETEDGIPLCFTQPQSAAKLEATVEAHGPVFTALGDLLRAKPDNRLVIMPGNHDADFFWDDVRERFAAAVCGRLAWDDARPRFTEAVCAGDAGEAGRLVFHLEQSYRPRQCEGAWIEHGHQYDPLNQFYARGLPCWSESARPIFRGRDGQDRLYECTGTRFLLRFMNQLDASYPFVDNVKPFSRFIYIFGLSALKGWSAPFRVALSVWAMLRYLGGTLLRSPSELLSLEPGEELPVAKMLSDALEAMSPAERREFSARVRARAAADAGAGFDTGRTLGQLLEDGASADALLDFLAANPDLLKALPGQDADAFLSVGGGGPFLSLGKGFYVDETAELTRAAGRLQGEHGTDVVLMGHTHERVDATPDVRYFNTGCWTRYYRHARDPKLGAWAVLKEGSYKDFPYQLNYAEVAPGRPREARIATHLPKGKT